MKKLKQLLKESYVWERKFGESLPTLSDVQKKYEEKQMKNEAPDQLEREKVPAVVNKFMTRFIDSLKDAKLTRAKQKSILYKVVKALGISPKELQMYTQRVKKGLEKK